MSEKFTALVKHDIWELVPLRSTNKPVGCKWVFRIKRNPDGSISRYKTRLVVKGFHQSHGFDYDKTFSPVVNLVTIQVVLSIAVQKIGHFDSWKLIIHFCMADFKRMFSWFNIQGWFDPNLSSHLCSRDPRGLSTFRLQTQPHRRHRGQPGHCAAGQDQITAVRPLSAHCRPDLSSLIREVLTACKPIAAVAP
ncbi:uncharacterized mitochondrial protein AtMg00820-like [Malania oleifera]|uniref:uncharacterized mitochondrial protein AtMg00820-like n=1 Tax=Malania oleifera TaxID=397392 RepID=UPI0025AE6751|nr:uncharacterized mitochondrial protein AtMg00820-like [Malania oleifera]